MIFIPIIPSFDFEVLTIDQQLKLSVTLTALLGIDVIIELFTNEHHEICGNVLSLSKSLKMKLRFIMLLDIISTIPFDIIFANRVPALILIRLTRLFSFPRVLNSPLHKRISLKLNRILKLNNLYVGIIFYIFVMLMFLHFHSCSIFLFESLLVHGELDSDPFELRRERFKSAWAEYTSAFWAAIANTFPVNSDIVPYETTEFWTASIMIFIGVILLACTSGTITALTLGSEPTIRRYKEHLIEVLDWMQTNNLPSEMGNRFTKYYELKYGGKIFLAESISMELNNSLNMEIANYVCSENVQSAYFLQCDNPEDIDNVFKKELCLNLRECFYVPDDHIFRVGDVCSSMYFIREGTVKIFDERSKELGKLTAGCFFGEESILTVQKIRTESAIASKKCILHRLDKTDWVRLLEQYPDFKPHVEK
ncbi:Potassium/sodium hyperpolarization-activated cyclic nucleotide-gated channel 4 [Nowakowskiella sp. JEL0078]|nr:Potassium/sodium hyperpolarization-activated cyclic nucleotide-gated channel 4 [Nowakowskiella sp. JEL0078]